MRYRQKILREIADHITRFGLNACPVCGTDSAMGASPLPVMLNIGGFQHERDDPRYDAEANVRFMVEVRCEVCGHSMFFDSAKFHGPNEPILTNLSRDEEMKAEQEDG